MAAVFPEQNVPAPYLEESQIKGVTGQTRTFVVSIFTGMDTGRPSDKLLSYRSSANSSTTYRKYEPYYGHDLSAIDGRAYKVTLPNGAICQFRYEVDAERAHLVMSGADEQGFDLPSFGVPHFDGIFRGDIWTPVIWENNKIVRRLIVKHWS